MNSELQRAPTECSPSCEPGVRPCVSIAIATYNRAKEISLTLEQLLRLDTTGVPDHEVLVIDNNSTDATAATVEQFAPRFGGRLRCVREGKQGLSYARNRGIQEARYEVVAYLDDDVDPHPHWLRHLTDAYASGGAAVVGGPAHLVYPVPKPLWLGDAIEGYLTKVDLGTERCPATADDLYGVNMSFRRIWLERVGGFRTDLGRVGTTLYGGEDTDILERVAARGGEIVYEPGASVGHRVPLSRLRRKWFLARAFWGSRSSPQLWPDERITTYEFARVNWWTLRAGLSALGSACWQGPRSAAVFEGAVQFAARLGLTVGLTTELFHRVVLQRRSRTASAVTDRQSTRRTEP